MSSEDIKRIEQEIVKRISDICKEYGDAFDIETEPIQGQYKTSIKCNFPGLKFD